MSWKQSLPLNNSLKNRFIVETNYSRNLHQLALQMLKVFIAVADISADNLSYATIVAKIFRKLSVPL